MTIIQSKSQLIDYFNKGKKKEDFKIGIEHEKFLFDEKTKNELTTNKLKKFLKI